MFTTSLEYYFDVFLPFHARFSACDKALLAITTMLEKDLSCQILSLLFFLVVWHEFAENRSTAAAKQVHLSSSYFFSCFNFQLFLFNQNTAALFATLKRNEIWKGKDKKLPQGRKAFHY